MLHGTHVRGDVQEPDLRRGIPEKSAENIVGARSAPKARTVERGRCQLWSGEMAFDEVSGIWDELAANTAAEDAPIGMHTSP